MKHRPIAAAVFALALSSGTVLTSCGSGSDGGSGTGGAPASTADEQGESTEPQEIPEEDGENSGGAETPEEIPSEEIPSEGIPSEEIPSEGIPSETESSTSSSAVVERIVDGDTLELSGDAGFLPRDTSVRVRLLEINAPEVGDCFSQRATDRLEELLPVGSEVRVEHDQDLKDPYGRHLLYVWNDQDEFVNRSLAESGHAESVLYEPNDKYWETISQADDAARQAGTGLWSGCAEETTPSPPSGTPEPSDPEPAVPETDTPDVPDGSVPQGPSAGEPDVDCSDVSGPVRVGPDDPHRLDADGDGVGCD